MRLLSQHVQLSQLRRGPEGVAQGSIHLARDAGHRDEADRAQRHDDADDPSKIEPDPRSDLEAHPELPRGLSGAPPTRSPRRETRSTAERGSRCGPCCCFPPATCPMLARAWVTREKSATSWRKLAVPAGCVPAHLTGGCKDACGEGPLTEPF